MARIDERRPEHIVNEKIRHIEDNRWETQRKFIRSSLEVFWNGQKLLSHDSENEIIDYKIIDDRTIEIVGVDNDCCIKDHFVCNYLVKS